MTDTRFQIVPTQPENAEACARLETLCYPTLSEEEHLKAPQFVRHVEIFPAGQLVAIDRDTDQVIGATGGFLTTLEEVRAHNFFEMTSHGWFSRHDPDARWYHGATMTVHPDYRGQGISRLFYNARKAMCQTLGLAGQVICGMMPGYAVYKHRIPAQEYVDYVCGGMLYDPTLTVQLRNGFVFQQLMHDYFEDPPTDGMAALMIWRPDTPA
jgi:GNAT superfamily N-acetyltransferase